MTFRIEDAQDPHFEKKDALPDKSSMSGSGGPSVITWVHREPESYEFGREPLVPYAKGYEGPGSSVADVNGDGLEDVYLCGGRKQPGVLFLQTAKGTWKQSQQTEFLKHEESEEIVALFFDADGDGDPDLITASGGNEARSGAQSPPANTPLA